MNDYVFIIAEAGVNHNGDMSLARELIRAAKDSGADAVKFQTFSSKSLTIKTAPKAAYQLQTTDKEENQQDMLKRLELPYEAHEPLKQFAESIGIEFMSTPFDIEAVDFLCDLGMKRIKIPSGEITNYPYLRHVARKKLPVIFSSGMSTLLEVNECLQVLVQNGLPRDLITVLHCTTEYPAPLEDVNLRAMETMSKALQVPIGYSDHTNGIEISLAAAALGAKVVEKHFTISRDLPGPDQKASLEPKELKALVTGIRHISQALGKTEKGPAVSERKNIIIARKSIVASRPIRKGELLSEKNLTTKRPGSGICPMKWEEIIGKPASRDFNPDELIEL